MDYLSLNLKFWNDRTVVHLESEFYDVAGFVAGKNPLNTIELDLLGDVKTNCPAFTMPFWDGYLATSQNECKSYRGRFIGY